MNFFDVDINDFVKTLPNRIKHNLKLSKSIRERIDYHPEQSTYEHILMVTDKAFQTNDADLVCSGILHDICKVDCVSISKTTGFPTMINHDKLAVSFIDSHQDVQEWIVSMGGNVDVVKFICGEHMRMKSFHVMKLNKRLNLTSNPHFIKLYLFNILDSQD